MKKLVPFVVFCCLFSADAFGYAYKSNVASEKVGLTKESCVQRLIEQRMTDLKNPDFVISRVTNTGTPVNFLARSDDYYSFEVVVGNVKMNGHIFAQVNQSGPLENPFVCRYYEYLSGQPFPGFTYNRSVFSISLENGTVVTDLR